MFASCGEDCESDFHGELIDLDDIIANSIRKHENVESSNIEPYTSARESLQAEEKDLREQNAELENQLVMHAAAIAAKEAELRNMRHALVTQTHHTMGDNESGNITPLTARSNHTAAKSNGSSNRQRASFYKGDMTAVELLSESEDGDVQMHQMAAMLNMVTLQGSALGNSLPVQALIYGIAFSGVCFVLIYSSQSLKEDGDGGHRRLAGDVLPIMKNTCFTVTCAGLVAFVVYLLRQPLILGYLLGGLLAGPIGLTTVPGSDGIEVLSELGLLLLLFMVGLELDIRRLLQMSHYDIIAGVVQFPICGAITYCALWGFHAIGISLGDTNADYAILYVGLTCGISSTILALNSLLDKGDAESPSGRLTIGIATCQDIWAVIFLAIQPHIDNPEPLEVLETIGKIVILVVIAIMYAKYVMPAIMLSSSSAVELVLVLSLAWCFFIVCIAMLPLMGLGTEMAALIAGITLATFPYSMEFNDKIKYIRDFFQTLFFAGLGMQIPALTISSIGKAFLVSSVLLFVRWLGIYIPVVALGHGNRLGVLTTTNLIHVSEFALVICSLGCSQGHIGADTLTIMIWVYLIVTVATANLLRYNYQVYSTVAIYSHKMGRMRSSRDETKKQPEPEEYEEPRPILLLGFHRVAAMLIHEFEQKSPHLIKQIQVIDFDDEIAGPLGKKGVKCVYGDFTTADGLSETVKGHPELVISTIPDTMLRGITNKQLLDVAMEVWPEANTIGIADTPEQQKELYEAGCSYVLRSAAIVAERLYGLLSEHCKQVGKNSQLSNIFQVYKGEDHRSSRSTTLRKSLGRVA